MGDERKSLFQRFNELSGIKKVSICAVALIVLLLLASVLSMSLLQIKEYNPQELKDLRDQYASFDIYAESYHAWATSLYYNDSEPANLSDVMKDDAKDVILDMHNDGKSIEEIAHALNEPVRIAYEEGIVDSPTLYDESFVKEAINGLG